MVGLKSFGDAAWACEQVFNTQLAEQRAAEPPLIEFATWVLGYLGDWVDDIAAHRDGERNEGEVKLAADRLRGASPAGEPAPTSPCRSACRRACRARADLRARRRRRAGAGRSAPAAATGEVAFELDLSGLDRAEQASAPVGRAAGARRRDLADVRPLRRGTRRGGSADQARTTIVDAPFDITSGPIDLDLGVPTDAAPLIELLEPSDTASPPTPDLLLDLSDLEALPDAARTSASRSMPLAPEPVARAAEPVAATAARRTPRRPAEPPIEEHVKVVGPLRISIPLFNIYLNEADELSRRLTTEVAEWAMELHRPLGETPIALAHSLAGSSATVGFTDLSHLARSLEHALARSQVIGHGTDEEARLFVERRRGDPSPAAPVRRRLPEGARAGLLARLAEHELELGAAPRGGDRRLRAGRQASRANRRPTRRSRSSRC